MDNLLLCSKGRETNIYIEDLAITFLPKISDATKQLWKGKEDHAYYFLGLRRQCADLTHYFVIVNGLLE